MKHNIKRKLKNHRFQVTKTFPRSILFSLTSSRFFYIMKRKKQTHTIMNNTVQDDLLAGSLFWRMAIYSTFRQY